MLTQGGSILSLTLFVQISANRFEIKKKLKTAKKKEKKEKKKKQEEEQEKKKLTQIQESQVGNETACSNKLFSLGSRGWDAASPYPCHFTLNVKQQGKQVRIWFI